MTNSLKKRFCRDMSVNIQVYDEPYFTDRLELFGYKERWDKLVELVNTKYEGNDQAFLEEYNNIKDKVIYYISNSEAFKKIKLR